MKLLCIKPPCHGHRISEAFVYGVPLPVIPFVSDRPALWGLLKTEYYEVRLWHSN